MAVADALITRLTGDERHVLDAWTAKFEASWHADRLSQIVQSPPDELKPHPQIYLTELAKIDLRKHWQSGQLRRVEGYLVEHPQLGTLETVSVELLHAEYLARTAAGRAGAYEDLAERFPKKAGALRDLIGRTESDASAPAFVAPQPAVPAPPKPEPKREDGLKFGRYRVVKQIHGDETGETYLAQDSIYDRRVHVKALRFGGRDAKERTDRFLREARAAAKLQHEHIGEVLEVGQSEGVPYIATAIVQGRPLADFINTAHPFTESKAAIIARQLSLALHDAHTVGVVHRDLKPANIIIDRNREPVLVNFGLARRVETLGDRDVFGTAAYIAPEQLTGQHPAGPATDQYNLGIVLFEMLTGRLPIEGNDETVLARKQADEIPPPSSVRADLDPRMDDIVARMTSRYVEDRFPNMQTVANALQSLLSDEDIAQSSSEISSPPEVVAPTPEPVSDPDAPAIASIHALDDADAIYAAEQRERAETFRRNGNYDALHEHLLALAQLKKPAFRDLVAWAREQLPKLKDEHRDAVEQIRILVATADEFIERHDYDQALQLLEDVPPGLETTAVRKLRKEANHNLEEIDELWNELSEAKGKGHKDEVQRLAWELEALKPNDKRLRQLRKEMQLQKQRRQETPTMSSTGAAGLVAGVLLIMGLIIVAIFLLRRPTTGQVSVKVNDEVLEVAIDGEPITLTGKGWEAAMEPETHTISVRAGTRDLTIGSPTVVEHPDGTIDTHELTVTMNGVTLSDGRFLVTRGQSLLLEVNYRKKTKEPEKPDPPPQVAGKDPQPPANKKPDEPRKKKEPPPDVPPRLTRLFVLRGHSKQVRSVTFTSDGSRLATCSYDRTGALWNMTTGQRIRQFRGNTRILFASDLTLDGKYFAGAAETNTAVIWDAQTGGVVSTCPGHTADVFTVRFSPDGKLIATAGHDRRLFVRRVPGTEKIHEIRAHEDRTNDIAFSPDGKKFASASSDRTAKVWSTETGELLQTYRGHTGGLRTVAFSPDGKTLVTSSTDQSANVYNAETAELKFRLVGHTHQLWVAAISPDGRFVATAGNDMNVIIWSLKTGKQLAKFKAHTDTIHCAAFSPDGRLFATGSTDKTAVVWRIDPP